MRNPPQRVLLVGQERARMRGILERSMGHIAIEESLGPDTAAQVECDAVVIGGAVDEQAIQGLKAPVLLVGGKCGRQGKSLLTLPGDAADEEIAGAVEILLELSRTRRALDAQTNAVGSTRRRHEMALEVAQIGTWMRDMRTGVVEWSPELCRIFGLPLDAFPRTHEEFFEYVHPADRERFLGAITRAVEERTNYDVEFRYRHSSGEYRWMAGKGRGFYDDRGTLAELAGVGIEITERKRVEARAADRESQLRQIGDHLPDGAMYQILVKPNGERGFIYWTAGLEQVMGVTSEEAVANAETVYGQLHPDDLPGLIALEQAALASQTVFDATVRSRHRVTGEWRWIHVRSAPRPLDDGNIVWDGLLLDVTELRKTQAELGRALERLDLAQRAGRIGVFDWDIRSGSVVWTEEEERIFGLEPGTFEGTIADWAKRVHPDDFARIDGELKAAMHARQELLDFAFRILTPRNEVRHIEGGGRFVYDQNGQALRMVGVNLDATERTLARHAMAVASRRKNEFLAMLAHELRNPLAALANSIEVCRPPANTLENYEWAHAVFERQTLQLTRLVDDLLDVSRITLGKIELRRTHVDLASVLDHAVAAVDHLVSGKRQTLTKVIETAPLPIDADATRIEQVVVNLLTNASKYTPPAGNIWLEALRSGDQVILTVRDDGQGIAPHRIPEMFELFSQGDRALARTEGGLGIGLTLVKLLVEMHGGEVNARSEGEGRGATFEVRLPVAKPGSSAPIIDGGRNFHDSQQRRILIVDDHVDTAETLARLLKRRKHIVEVSHDGPGAMLAAQAFQPEFVFLDLGLPGMDGFEVISKLREMERVREATFVAISGYGQQRDIERSLASGFAAHFTKPVQIERIHALLEASRYRGGRGLGGS